MVSANLAAYEDVTDQLRPTHTTAIIEGVCPKIITFGLKDCVVRDGRKAAACYKLTLSLSFVRLGLKLIVM